MRRWFQFGVLDLLIVTTIGAVAAVLWRPAQPRTNKAPPWVVGVWLTESLHSNKASSLKLYPDGCYSYYRGHYSPLEHGFRWTVTPVDRDRDAFALVFGDRRLIIRSAWGSRVIEVLNEDGGIESRLVQTRLFEGQWHDGAPHGLWKMIDLISREEPADWLKYRHGVPFEGYDSLGRPTWALVDAMRRSRGLPEISEDATDDR
jgi:hypothetical protein